MLGGEGERVGLQLQRPVRAADRKLVARALRHVRHEQLPDPGGAERAHRVQARVPAVEVARDADRTCRRRPDGERHAGHAVVLDRVRAELLVELLVTPLARQVQVELAERRQERVRVAQREAPVLAVVDLELVAERQLGTGDRAGEDAAGVQLLECDLLAGAGAHDDAPGLGPVHPDDRAGLCGMRPEQRVGVGERAGEQRVDVVGEAHAVTSSSRIRAMPATGMPTHSGRLSRS
ncbi:MAG: hypothetical protein MUC84_11820 [Solirubrobacteraceae bacterium]|nr:hypothetical protein [Solirubrobacteraceae bacterium]